MNKENVLLGLKRASWLFGLVTGLITIVVISSSNGRYFDWENTEKYLPHSTIACIAAFAVFRMGIWVFNGFAGPSSPENQTTNTKARNIQESGRARQEQEIQDAIARQEQEIRDAYNKQ